MTKKGKNTMILIAVVAVIGGVLLFMLKNVETGTETTTVEQGSSTERGGILSAIGGFFGLG